MDQKRILIVRPDRLGDVVLSTPIPREIKKQFPGSYVSILLRKYAVEVYLNNPHIDQIILLDDNSYFQKVSEIRKYNFTHSLSLIPNEPINYMLFLAGIHCRIGVGYKLYQFITNTKSVHRQKYNPLRHEADYCLDLARKIGVDSNNYTTELFLDEKEKQDVAVARNFQIRGRKHLIGIHSTSGNSAPNWSKESYRQLILELTKQPEYSIVITDQVKNDLFDIPGVTYPHLNLSLRESIINFAALDMLVSNSTGPMHICAALKIKTVSMFCPLNACSPKLWGPLGNVNEILLPKYSYCQYKCPGDPKKCTFEGEHGINVEDVVEKIEAILKQ
ncbi:MAG: glycosyltransferase family 9 protein [bacterium]